MVSEEQKKKNRAKYCDWEGKCPGTCIALQSNQTVVKCEHFISEDYEFFGLTLNAINLETREMEDMPVFPCGELA